MNLRLPKRLIRFPRRPLVMGIVNINDDSFSGDGTLDVDGALAQVREQIQAGADVIDLGAESARTNRRAIHPAEEVERLRGVLDLWPWMVSKCEPMDEEQVWPPVLSVNTWRPEVVKAVLPMGVELVNDMSGLPDGKIARLCAASDAALLIMHSVGEPKVAHTETQWEDVMGSMRRFFLSRIALAQAAGLEEERIVIDPGIDFAKQKEDNLTVYRELAQLQDFERPVLLPVSRKTVIGEVLDLPDPRERDAGTVACIALGVKHGAQIFRVHDVKAAWESVKVLWAVERVV